MKTLKTFINDSLITEAAKAQWSNDEKINDIFLDVFGERTLWLGGGHSKDLTKMVSTFSKWYNDGDNLTWWSASKDFGKSVKVTSNEKIYDIRYGEVKHESNKYMDPCTIYATDSFWGVQFYEQIIVCGKNGKTLKDLTAEVYDKKQEAIEATKKALAEREKQDLEAFNNRWDNEVVSNARDNQEFSNLSQYKGKVVKVTLTWEGFADEYTFIATLTSIQGRTPNFDLPLSENFKVISLNEKMDFLRPSNYHDGPDGFFKLSATWGSIFNTEKIIVKSIEEVSKADREKYLKIVGEELDKQDDNKSWYRIVYNHLTA